MTSTKVKTDLKLSCQQKDLHAALAMVGRATSNSSTLAICGNVRIDAAGGKLKLTATNLELSMVTTIEAKVDQEGSFTLPCKLLNQFVGSVPNNTVDLELSNKRVSLKCGKYSVKIAGAAVEDYPPLPDIADPITLTLKGKDLKDAINHVDIAMAPNTSRLVLSGISLEIQKDGLEFAAADSIRLAVYSLKVNSIEKQLRIIIPGKTAQELARVIDNEDEDITVLINAQHIVFKLAKVEISSLLVQGEFPRYASLIPQNLTNKATLDRLEFLDAVKITSIFTGDEALRIHIVPGGEFVPGKLILYTSEREVGESNNEVDAIVTATDTSKIAFESRFISEALSVIKADQVSIETLSPSSPCVIKPLDDEPFLYVVMPRFVAW